MKLRPNLKLVIFIALTITILVSETRGAVEHFDMSNAHAHSSFTPTSTLMTNNGLGSSQNIVSRSGSALAQNTAQNRGSYGIDPNPVYNGGNVQQPTAVTVGQVVSTSGSLGSASSISSYGVPATGGGGYGGQGLNTGGSPGTQTYYYYHYPPPGSAGVSGGIGWGEYSNGDDDDSLKGLSGLAGLLGLKGLKGLALLKLAKPLLLLPLLALALPLLLLPLLFLLLFVPIPVFTMPAQTGRSPGSSMSVGENLFSSSFQIVQQVLNGSQCVERIACEVSLKTGKGNLIDSVINTVYEKTETFLPKIWIRGLRTYIDSSGQPELENKCAKFNCKEFSAWDSGEENSLVQRGESGIEGGKWTVEE